MQDDKTQVVAAVKELFPLIAKPLPEQREQITEDLSRIIHRFRPFLLEKLGGIALEGGEIFSSDEDRSWVSEVYEEQGVRLTLSDDLEADVYLLPSGDFLEVQKAEVTKSKSPHQIYTTWKRPTPKKVGIYSVSTPEVLTGIKWLVLEYFLDLDEKDLLALRPFSKEFIQFILAGCLEKKTQEIQDMARSILLKIGGESVPVLGEAIVDAHSDYDKKLILAKILGEIGDRRGDAPLFQVLKDVFNRDEISLSLPYHVNVAVEALEKIAGKDLSFPDENSRIAFYIVRLSNPLRQPGDRQEAVDSLLPYVENDRVARWLLNYMASESCSLELQHYIGSKFVERGDHRVIESLAKIMARDRARAHSRNIWESEKREETKVATKLLGNLGGKEAERILIDAVLNDSEEVRRSARDALIKIGDSSIVEPLAEGIIINKNEYKKTLNKDAYEQAKHRLDEAYEVLRTIDKRPRTFLDNLLGRRKY